MRRLMLGALLVGALALPSAGCSKSTATATASITAPSPVPAPTPPPTTTPVVIKMPREIIGDCTKTIDLVSDQLANWSATGPSITFTSGRENTKNVTVVIKGNGAYTITATPVSDKFTADSVRIDVLELKDCAPAPGPGPGPGPAPGPGPGPAECTYQLSKAGRHFGYLASWDDFQVITQAGCKWTARSNASYVTIRSGASGTGPGVVTYDISQNNLTSSRATSISVETERHSIDQDGAPDSIPPITINPPTLTLYPPSCVAPGQSSTGTLTANMAATWSSSAPNIASVPSGSATTVTVTASAPGTATITARGPQGQTASAVITVQSCPTLGELSCNIDANPSSIAQGGTSVVSWNSANAVTVVPLAGFTGALALSGTREVILSQTTTFTIRCTRSDGAFKDASKTVNVTAPACPSSIDYSPKGGTRTVGSVFGLLVDNWPSNVSCVPYWYSGDPSRFGILGGDSIYTAPNGSRYFAGVNGQGKAIAAGSTGLSVQTSIAINSVFKTYTWTAVAAAALEALGLRMPDPPLPKYNIYNTSGVCQTLECK